MRRLALFVAPVLFSCFLVPASESAQVRVVTWNLRLFPSGTFSALPFEAEEKRILEVANFLKELNPDVILLQEVRDQEVCQRLITHLQPQAYHLLVCSDFSDVETALNIRKQLAILSKQPALAAWSERWRVEQRLPIPGGFAFAAIAFGAETIGFYSIHLKNNLTHGNFERENQLNILRRELSIESLLGQVGSLRDRLTNRLEAFVVGGNFNTTPDQMRYVSERSLKLLQEAGFNSGYDEVPLAERITCPGKGKYPDVTFDYIFAKGAGFSSKPAVLSSTDLSDHYPVVCDLMIQSALSPVIAETADPAPTSKSEPNAISAAPAVLPDPKINSTLALTPARAPPRRSLWTWLAPALGLALVLVWLLGLQRRVRSTIARHGERDSFSEQPVVVPPETETHVVGTVATTESARALPVEAAPRAIRESDRGEAALVRSRLIPHLARLMKDKLVFALMSQRSHLLDAHQTATLQVVELEQRLAQIQAQLHERYVAYEKRIAELEKALDLKEAENRELMSAKLLKAKKSLEAERQSAQL
jgi:endonuclease/exonuclease/phosphatase family metal-dependent hydrolase